MSALGGGVHQLERLKNDAAWSLETVAKYARPKAAIEQFEIDNVSSETITIKQAGNNKKVTLTVGPKADLLKNAGLAQISIGTLGPKLDELRQDLKNQNMELRSFVLDTTAILALGRLGQQVNRWIENQAAQQNWGVSPRMAPGSLNGWTMEDQKQIAVLLPFSSIGVDISSSGMLIPLKSATALVGVGPSYESASIGTVCQWCRHQHHCIVKHLTPLPNTE